MYGWLELSSDGTEPGKRSMVEDKIEDMTHYVYSQMNILTVNILEINHVRMMNIYQLFILFQFP